MQVDTPEIAEAAKLLENSFRQINISFINEFNLLCRKLGIDTREVIRAASTKPFGFMPFSPSVGIGGHCIPVDPLYFQHALSEIGEKSEFIGLASRVNNEHPSRLIEFVLSQAGVKLPKILILGVAYKRGIADTRETPALTLIEDLNQRGLTHGWFDPLVNAWNGEVRSDLKSDWDIALILTAQPGLPIENLISRGVQIFDFTGEYLDNPKVIQV
jgi:UDP-N-acetyl-D-glucosamine dehydrogenase